MDTQNVLIGMASLLTKHESSAVQKGGYLRVGVRISDTLGAVAETGGAYRS